jgi:dolichyl-phosphate-mannose-protein mannosyltransferase
MGLGLPGDSHAGGPRKLALTAIAFGVIPFVIYVASYLPWMGQGHALKELWPHTKAIWVYHAGLRATHPYFSSWYTWPWLYRPTWYYFNQSAPEAVVRGIVAIGNPALWWASVPVTLWALVTGARDRDPRRLFSGLGYCFLYLPWGVSPRQLNYSHYLFEAIPYACLSLGMLLDRNWDGPGLRRLLSRGYVVLVVVLYFFFLPFLLALPIPISWYYFDIRGWRPWTWFPTWV